MIRITGFPPAGPLVDHSLGFALAAGQSARYPGELFPCGRLKSFFNRIMLTKQDQKI